MLPGMGGLVDQIDVDDKKMNRLEALFTSMTPRERLNPDLLDMGRRRRIARGAGQDVGAINELLKSFKGMKQLMKEMNKLGLGARMGMKEKKEALRGMSPDGDLLGTGPGALEGLFGGGGGGPAMPPGGGLGGLGGLGGMGGLGGLFGGGRTPRPMGSSATRQSGSKRKKDKRKKKRR